MCISGLAQFLGLAHSDIVYLSFFGQNKGPTILDVNYGWDVCITFVFCRMRSEKLKMTNGLIDYSLVKKSMN